MNRDGSCCIARYGGGMYGVSKVDRIMMKYRPIAPKPVVTGSGLGSGGSSTENSCGYVKYERTKRKYVRVNKTKKKNTSKRKLTPPPPSSASQAEPELVTLSLLPQTPTPDRVHNFSVPDLSVETTTNTAGKRKPVWLSFNNQEQRKVCYGQVIDMNEVVTKRLRVQPQVVSYVTVECVTDTWLDKQLLGYTDEEKLRNMEVDTCPGFITDGQDRVIWTNQAYRKMAGEDIIVVLVRKDLSTFSLKVPAFTCKVRVASGASSNGLTLPSLTVPCDVWRMEHGGCAWRLDVKTALSLGR